MANNGDKKKDIWDKLDILGKLTSSIIFVLIALFLKIGADKIAVSLETGSLVQSLITDLTTLNQKTRQDVALIALDHTVGDEKPQLVSEIAQRIFEDLVKSNPSEQDSALGSVAWKICLRRDPQSAEQQREQMLIAQVNELQKLRPQEGKGAKPQIEKPTVKTRLLSETFPNLVYIQFQPEDQRERMESLRNYLNQNGYYAPGVEHVKDNFNPGVRFFHPGDATLAEEVARVTETFMQEKGRELKLRIIDLSGKGYKVREHLVEIWLKLNDSVSTQGSS